MNIRMMGIAMIKNLLRKNQIKENLIDAQATETGDAVNTGMKKKSLKRQLIAVLIFFLLAGIGFAGVTLMANDDSSSKKIQGAYRQLSAMQPFSQSPLPPAALQAQEAHAQNSEVKRQRAESAVHYEEDATQKVEDLTRNSRRTTHNAEERDVFKEFYLRHGAPGAALTKGPAMHLEQNLPDLTRLLNANSGAQALPPVQTLPVNEQPIEVKIYGITCIGETGLLDDKCAAITSEGVLKKGDKLGSETVFAVNKTSLATSKRTVEFN